MYLLHPIYFTDVGWPPNFISNLRGARRAGGREWKFSQSPGTAEGIEGGTRAALGVAGRGLHRAPHPTTLGGTGGVRPAVLPPALKTRARWKSPRSPLSLLVLIIVYIIISPILFLIIAAFSSGETGEAAILPPPSCLVTTTPPRLSPQPPAPALGSALLRSLHLPAGGWGDAGGLRGREEAVHGRGFPGAAMLLQPCPLRDGQPGTSRLFAITHGRGGSGGVSPRVRARVPRPGEGAARRGAERGERARSRPRGAPAAGLPLFRVPIKYALPPPASAITGGARASSFFKSHRKCV